MHSSRETALVKRTRDATALLTGLKPEEVDRAARSFLSEEAALSDMSVSGSDAATAPLPPAAPDAGH